MKLKPNRNRWKKCKKCGVTLPLIPEFLGARYGECLFCKIKFVKGGKEATSQPIRREQ